MTARAGLWVMGAYLLGSIPTGYWLGELWRGVDVRHAGSGNLGATNVYRVLGVWPAAATLLIDILKGLVPVLLCRRAFPADLTLPVLVGMAAILGHMTSVFVQFHGGKGVATTGGVFIALLPLPTVIAFTIFLATFAWTRIVSLSSLLAVIALALASCWWSPTLLLRWTAFTIAAFVLWTHRANIKRLAAGTELPLQRKS